MLAEKVEEGRFAEEYAVHVAHRLLRDNARENFRVAEKIARQAERTGVSS